MIPAFLRPRPASPTGTTAHKQINQMRSSRPQRGLALRPARST